MNSNTNRMFISPEQMGHLMKDLALHAGHEIATVDMSTNPLYGSVMVRLTKTNGSHFIVDVPECVRLMSSRNFAAWLVEKYSQAFKPLVNPEAERKTRVRNALHKAIDEAIDEAMDEIERAINHD